MKHNCMGVMHRTHTHTVVKKQTSTTLSPHVNFLVSWSSNKTKHVQRQTAPFCRKQAHSSTPESRSPEEQTRARTHTHTQCSNAKKETFSTRIHVPVVSSMNSVKGVYWSKWNAGIDFTQEFRSQT